MLCAVCLVVQCAHSVSFGVVCIVYWQAALPFEWPQTQIMTTADVGFESISDEYFKQQVISVDFALRLGNAAADSSLCSFAANELSAMAPTESERGQKSQTK